jgi:hypothetical protein
MHAGFLSIIFFMTILCPVDFTRCGLGLLRLKICFFSESLPSPKSLLRTMKIKNILCLSSKNSKRIFLVCDF